MMAKKENNSAMNPVELFYSKYDPNLRTSGIREMLNARKKDDSAFNPISKNWWNLGPGGCSYALISMCIKENLQQTASELALRLSEEKNIPFTAAAYVVWLLREKKRLFYYDAEQCICLWEPKVVIGRGVAG